MFDEYLRRLKDRLLAPVALRLGVRVSPNALSFLALVVGVLAALAASRHNTLMATVLWLVNRALDGLDGTQARVHHRQSDFGGYLDIVFDFVVYAAVPIGLVVAQPDLAMPGLWLLASFFVNAASWMYLAAILERRQAGAASRKELTTVTMPPGLVAGTETVVLYTVMLSWPASCAIVFPVMATLVMFTVVQRLWWAKTRLRG
jgi:phosphatidylglycerophosphate synthase